MCMVPDQLPETVNESVRKRTLERVRRGLAGATQRLNIFLDVTPNNDVIKRIHTAKTEIINDQDEHEIVDYYSLWTEFADIRLMQNGWLLRSDYPTKREDEKTNGYDKSEVISILAMREDPQMYTALRLGSLADKLDHFLAEYK